jgi:subtilase family serine protease
MEPTEVREFTEEVKEGAEKSLTHVSLIIAVLAVVVAMVTVLGHREHTEAVLLQTRAADQWNEYQSRKVRVQELGVASDLLSLQPSNDSHAVQTKLDSYKSQMTKWQKELTESAAKAHDLEDEVDVAERKAARFDLGEALLEIAVILASITLLTRREAYVRAAVILAVAGVVIGASAFLVK